MNQNNLELQSIYEINYNYIKTDLWIQSTIDYLRVPHF